MIHTRVTRDSSQQLDGIHIHVTAESLSNFQALINRALNCWDSAPKELKELGDMLTHGYVTQDHTYVPMRTTGRDSSYYTPEETAIIHGYIEKHGADAWINHLKANTQNKVLNQEPDA